jgi:hypothetical protein
MISLKGNLRIKAPSRGHGDVGAAGRRPRAAAIGVAPPNASARKITWRFDKAAALMRELITPDDGERLRCATAQASAVGGDVAWLGDAIAAWHADQPNKRLRRRDEAIVALAAYCERGSTRDVATQIAETISKYEATRWPREELMGEAPESWGALGAVLFAVMRASRATGSPQFQTVRNALAAAWKKDSPRN